MQEYIVNENGEKVLLGSRRPDGTIRKERRIRAGYIPQDEQPTYDSRGMMARSNIPRCPGLDPAAASGGAAAAAAKSKAAKKNEKRKAKKSETGTQQPSSSSSSAAAPALAAQTPQQHAAPAAAAPPAAVSQPPAAADGAAVLDKQIKTLGKKVRQCQALLDKQATGEPLSHQEQEKVSKMSSWQDEIKQLEHQLAKLAA